jgi:calcineurin-like phosphoesterase family protein
VTIWLISDMHFWHENMYTFTTASGERVRARFASAREGDEYMIQRWNELVTEQDRVWWLGDVVMERGNNQRDRFTRLIGSLKGHKRLVLGNHDHYNVNVYREAGFQKVRGSNLLDGFLLTHYPVHPSSIGFKVKANVHGHIHEKPSPPGKYINVSVERINYEPIPLEVVKDMALKLDEPVVDVGGSVMEE